MSEGATRNEGAGSVYYGTTSILLPLKSAGGQLPDEHFVDAAKVLSADPHLRLRALRLACREASLRANGRLRCVHAEMRFSQVQQGLQIDVDVEAVQATSIRSVLR